MSQQQLERFFVETEKRAFCMARLAVGNEADALDIVQDAMMKLVENYRDKSPEEWKPLFNRILQNRIMDFHRGAKNRRLFVSNEISANDDEIDIVELAGSNPDSPAAMLSAERLGEKLLAAIGCLPVQQQQCFLLRSWQGLSTKETATAMRVNSGTVKVHYSRALAKLKPVLEEHHDY